MIDTPTDELNIKDFVIEDPGKNLEPIFNPAKEITASDWKRIDEELGYEFSDFPQRITGLDEAFVFTAALLDPQAVGQHVNKGDTWSLLTSDLGEKGNMTERLRQAAAMKMSNPKRAMDQDLISDLEWRYFYNDFDDMANSYDKLRVLGLARILDPNRLGKFSFNDDQWDRVRVSAHSARDNQDWMSLARQAAVVKLFDPRRVDELEITGTEWQHISSEIREDIDLYRNDRNIIGGVRSFTEIAAVAKILAAEDIKISDRGIEFIMPKSQSDFSQKAGVPELRKF